MKKSKAKWDWIYNLNYKLLENEYKNDSIPGVATKFGVHKKWVAEALNYYGIPIKSIAETSKQVSYKVKNTCKEKYGVECVFNLERIRNNCSSVKSRQKAKETTIKTNLLKHGVESTNYLDKVKKKISEANKNKTKEEKERILEKRKQTNLEKFGVDNYTKTKEFKQFYKINAKKFKEKEILTKTNNGTIWYSQPELDCEEILINNYGKTNVIKQYKSIKYPFYCDFYIKNLNLYIELNITWTHGFHEFDSNNKEDINRLKFLIEKAKSSKYYNQAVYVWTDLDKRKINIAKENNLNYICIYDKNEIQNIIEIINNYFHDKKGDK